MFVTSAKHMII